MPSARQALVAVLLLLLVPGGARAQDPGEVADALTRDPVVVAPAKARQLGAAAAGRVRVRVARRAAGRLAVAVVPERTLEQAGGSAAYANAVDAASTGVRGALLVTSGRSWYAVTTHDADAAGALREALDATSGSLEVRLLAAVDALATIDPGPSGDPEAQTEVPLPGEVTDELQGVARVARRVLLGLAAVIGLPFLVAALLLTARGVRRARGGAEARAEALEVARERLLAVGEGLRELDPHESAPGAAPVGRAAYGVVLDRYDRADHLLRHDPSARQVRRADRALEEAEIALRTARSQLAGDARLVGLG